MVMQLTSRRKRQGTGLLPYKKAHKLRLSGGTAHARNVLALIRSNQREDGRCKAAQLHRESGMITMSATPSSCCLCIYSLS